MLQRLLMLISVGAALAVLAVLVMRTQSEPQTLQGHFGRMTVLAQLGAADAEADTQVTRARLSLEAAPAGLADATARLEYGCVVVKLRGAVRSPERASAVAYRG